MFSFSYSLIFLLIILFSNPFMNLLLLFINEDFVEMTAEEQLHSFVSHLLRIYYVQDTVGEHKDALYTITSLNSS